MTMNALNVLKVLKVFKRLERFLRENVFSFVCYFTGHNWGTIELLGYRFCKYRVCSRCLKTQK